MRKKFLFLSGSTRKESFNTTLARYCAEVAKTHDVDVEFVDLADFPMPIFNQDLESESGAPETAKALKEKFVSANGFLIASPEYNSTITPVLKNTIDWLSRKYDDSEPRLVCFSGKAAAIVSTASGVLGGLRGLDPLRLLLSHIGVNVVGKQLAVGFAQEAFDEKGKLVSQDQAEAINTIIETLIRIG